MELFFIRWAGEGEFPRGKFLESAAARPLLGEITVTRSENGRPIPSSGFLSFTHSGDCALLALHSGPIGVDLEKEGRTDGAKLAARFFSPEEAAAVALTPALFLPLWTAKEALFKQSGEPSLLNFLKREAKGTVFFPDLPGLVCAVASQSPPPVPRRFVLTHLGPGGLSPCQPQKVTERSNFLD